MTGIGRNEYERWLEQELREAAPEARALFVDELARRVHAQRSRLRPGRARLGLALAFSALMIVALGVLGAPGYVAHAANAVVQTATTLSGGGSGSTAQLSTLAATSGTDQYAIDHGICNRGPNNQFTLVFVSAADLDTHAARGDIIPAPPWGCPPNPSKGVSPSATTTLIGGPTTAKAFKSVTFLVGLQSADGKTPQGTISCFDNLHRFAASVAVDGNGEASCTTSFQTAGAHAVTAVFKTADVNKWASSAGNVTTVNVAKVTSVLTLASDLTPAPVGAGITFTSDVAAAPGAPAPAGSMEFRDGTTVLGSVDVSSGEATFTTNTLDVGSHVITASYSGDAAYDAGNAPGVSQLVQAVADNGSAQQQQSATPASVPAGPQTSASTNAESAQAGSLTVAAGGSAPLTVAWAPGAFGAAPAHVSATVRTPVKTEGVQFAAGSAVLEIDAVTDSGQAITALNDALDITIPDAPADVAPMYQRGNNPWVIIPRLSGTTLPAGQPDGWYRHGSTIHILTRHLTKFGLATALDVKWGTRRHVHLRWAQRIVVYGAPSVDATATYTLRRGKKVYGTWKRTLPAGKGAPANLWLTAKNVGPGLYRLTIVIQAGPQRWTQVVAIRYLR